MKQVIASEQNAYYCLHIEKHRVSVFRTSLCNLHYAYKNISKLTRWFFSRLELHKKDHQITTSIRKMSVNTGFVMHMMDAR